MTQYLKFEDNEKRTLFGSKPNWYNEKGKILTDSELITKENMYPVYNENVTEDYDWLLPKDKSIWELKTDYVEKKFWRVFRNSPDYDPLYQNISAKPQFEWTQDGDKLYQEWNISELTVDQTKDKMVNEIADKRWRYETGGMTYTTDSGITVKLHTGRESQSKLASVSLAVKQGSITTNKQWKTVEGFVELTPTELENLGEALNSFVQSCYDNEKRILDLIMGCSTISNCQDVYYNEFNSNWPTNAIYGG